MTARATDLDAARAAWRRGDLAAAEGRLAAHLRNAPEDAAALGLLGTVKARRGELDGAIELLERAARLDPKDATAPFNLGNVLRRQGRTAEAVAAFRAAVAIAPRAPEPLIGLAAALLDQGDPARLEEAERLCRRAIRQKAGFADAHNILGTALKGTGRKKEAEAAFRTALSHTPGHPQALANLGNLLAAQRRHSEAAEIYVRAIAADPENPDTRHSLGNSLLALKRLDEAEVVLRSALALKSGHAAALEALGNVMIEKGLYTEAMGLFEEALAAGPTHPETILYNLGNALRDLNREDEAEATYRRALAVQPNHAATRANLLFGLCYKPNCTPEQLLAAHREQGEVVAAAVAGRVRTRHRNDPDPERRLKVGYLSPDFKRHTVTCFTEPVLSHHDPAAVEVTCYANVAEPDDRTEHLRSLVPRWRDVTDLSDDDLADRIAADRIDVLVELAGYTRDSRIDTLALRPAPVQVSYLGYPATTGLAAVGWRVTDAVCDPPGTEAFYTERLVRLKGLFCTYGPPANAPPVTPLPALEGDRFTFGTLINPQKLNNAVIALWARVLQTVRDARVLIFRTALHNPAVRHAYEQAFAAHGLGPDRVTFDWDMPEGGHLAVYGKVDACLDTFPFCGHTTTCEALWMGVPTVTLAGRFFAGRMGASLLPAVGLSDLVAADADGFVAAAARLAADPAALANLRASLRERVQDSPLCDAAGFTRNLEAAYREMWTDWCAERTR